MARILSMVFVMIILFAISLGMSIAIGFWSAVFFALAMFFVIYYHIMFQIAESIIPAANPDDKQEISTRFNVLLGYSLNLQYPCIIVTDHAGQKYEARIEGDIKNRYGMPGMIWARSYHAVGLKKGPLFSRIAGPGIIFTERFEEIEKVIDLRRQSRFCDIEGITEKGVPFIATLRTAFMVDNREWDRETYYKLYSANPLLRDGKKLDHNEGAYPYSRARIRAIIRTRGINSESSNVEEWDDDVMDQIVEEAHHVLSERDVDSFWDPQNKNEGASALTEISDEIKTRAADRLQKQGILLLMTRITSFQFPKSKGEKSEDAVLNRQIDIWVKRKMREIDQSDADADAEAKLEEERARAEDEIEKLNMFNEILLEEAADKTTRRKVVAVRLLAALKQIAKESIENPAAFQGNLDSLLRAQFTNLKRDLKK